MRSRRPRAGWHTVAGSVVAAYLLAAAVVVGAHRLVAVPQWLALHLLVLGAGSTPCGKALRTSVNAGRDHRPCRG